MRDVKPHTRHRRLLPELTTEIWTSQHYVVQCILLRLCCNFLLTNRPSPKSTLHWMAKPGATQHANKNNKRHCGQSKQQVFEEFCGKSKFLFFFPSSFFDRAHDVKCSSKYLFVVNDAHQSLLLCFFTSLQN